MNHHRTLPGHLQDVGRNLLQRDRRAVEFVDVLLRASIQFRPNLVRARQQLQSLLNFGPVQGRRIGHHHDLEKRHAAKYTQVDQGPQRIAKMACQGRFAVAADGDVADLQQFVRQIGVTGPLAQTARIGQREGRLQFFGHFFDIKLQDWRGLAAVDFAVHALEIAGDNRVHVDTDGETSGPRGDHEINELILQKIARIPESHVLRDHGLGRRVPVSVAGRFFGRWLHLSFSHH